ncbi:MAG: alpha/beta hydrolase [Acidimicrobiales bacterium]
MTTTFRQDVFHLDADETGFLYEITVETPNRYPSTDDPFPLVVCLDGLWTYGTVRDSFRILSLGKRLPEAVVVGVAHAHPELREVMQQRAVDFTPTEFEAPAETGVRLPADEVGRAHRFRRFLVDTLVPQLCEDYRVSDDRTLVGHSFSALFGLDTLLCEPAAFGRWVLASPSIWWDDRVMFAREAAHAAATPDVAARLFLSAGGDEISGSFGGHDVFHRQLAARHHPGLRLDWALIDGEDHRSVIPTALSRGLRAVFAL